MDKARIDSIANEIAAVNAWGKPDYIDSGASASVYAVEHPAHGRAALKVYDPELFVGDAADAEKSRLLLQAQLADVDHKNLIKIFEIGESTSHATWYILMEFCPWKSLEKSIAGVPDSKVADLIRQLTDAVIKLTELNLVHRDIKPANIIVSDEFDELKLLDLGVIRRISRRDGNGTDFGEKRRFLATVQYSPPEYIPREEPEGEDGFAALNVYQIGAVLHDMIMKRPLFEEEALSLNKYRLFKAVLNKKPSVFSSSVPPRLVSLCRAALDKDPQRRIEAVKVSDFGVAEETLSEVRRRLGAARRQQPESAAPSTMLWAVQVRGWITAAARAERDVLGAYRLEECACNDGHTWCMSFDDIEASVFIHLRRVAGEAYIALSINASDRSDGGYPALEIYEDGPNVPVDQIVPQLGEQLLIALDEAGSITPANGEAQ